MISNRLAQVGSRYGWLLVLIMSPVLVGTLASSVTTWQEWSKFLSLVAFSISLAAAESRLGWPRAVQRPLVGTMWVIGTLLMFVAAFAKELQLFETLTLLAIFTIALKGVGDWFGPGRHL